MNWSHRFLASLALALSLTGVARGQSIDVDGFDPRLDGLPFVNKGTSANPRGNCFGMTLVAIDNYLRRTRVIGPPAPPRESDKRFSAALYPEEHALVTKAQSLTQGLDSWSSWGSRMNPPRPLDDPEPIAQSLARMAAGGPPEVILYWGAHSGHASLVYGYVDGMLQVYDPNFPGETIRWPYDPVRGLGPHPKSSGSAFYSSLTQLSSTPHEQFETSHDLVWVRQACRGRAKACTSEFPTIRIETKLNPAGRLMLRGRWPTLPPRSDRPYNRVDRIWITVDGEPIEVLHRFSDDNGKFAITLPDGVYHPGAQVRVVATDHYGMFAGFTDAPPPQPADVPPPAAEPTATSAGETPPRKKTRGLAGALTPNR